MPNCADCESVLDAAGGRRPHRRKGSALAYCRHCWQVRRGRLARPAKALFHASETFGGVRWGGITRSEPEAWFRKDAALSSDIFCIEGMV